MKKRVFFTIITIVFVLSVGFIPDIILSGTAKVSTVKPQLVPVSKYVYATGTIKPANMREIYLSAPVYPSMVNVSVGQNVVAGEVLAYIDVDTTMNILTSSTPIEAQLSQITELVGKLPDPSILYAMGKAYGIDKEQVDSFYNTAKYTQTESKVYYIPKEIINAFDGTVTQVGIEDNVLNYPNNPAFVISDLSSLKGIMQVSQKDADLVKRGMKCIVSYGDIETIGTVTSIAPIAKENLSGTPTVDIEVDIESSTTIKAGYAVQCKVIVEEDIMSYSLPMEAINQDENNDEYVYVYRSSIPIKVPVEIVGENIYGVNISKGISCNDIVLLNPQIIEKNKHVVIVGK